MITVMINWINYFIIYFGLVEIFQAYFSKLKSLSGNVSQIGKVKRVHMRTYDRRTPFISKHEDQNVNKIDSCIP